MKTGNTGPKDLYFTKDHEWVDFRGAVAYTGVCGFKLLGFKEIDHIELSESSGLKKQGDILATIHYRDYQIKAHMPVDGKILQLNYDLVTGNKNILLLQPETSGWIAKIAPAQPYDRNDLLLPKQYQLNGKDKYAK
jgi:glycine cleavage system H protein